MSATHKVLSRKYIPTTRLFPRGISWPYDLRRIYEDSSIQTIFDVGANIGQTSIFLNQYFPKANIYAFEPVLDTYLALQQNCISYENVSPQKLALADKKSTKTIALYDNSELNTLVSESKASVSKKARYEQVQIETVDNFCNTNCISSIDILKMDVQGYEMNVLKGASQILLDSKIKFIYSEISFNKNNFECQEFSELKDFLEQHDFCFSGFYEFFRWGKSKRYFGFCNALFVHKSLN